MSVTTFAMGAAFVAAIAREAEQLDHAPLVDVRPDTVAVQVITIGVGPSDVDLELARRISAIAREMNLEPNPDAVQQVRAIASTSTCRFRTIRHNPGSTRKATWSISRPGRVATGVRAIQRS